VLRAFLKRMLKLTLNNKWSTFTNRKMVQQQHLPTRRCQILKVDSLSVSASVLELDPFSITNAIVEKLSTTLNQPLLTLLMYVIYP
jgi:hypothetical protein